MDSPLSVQEDCSSMTFILTEKETINVAKLIEKHFKWSYKQQNSELFQEQLGQTLAENSIDARVNW